MKSLDLETLLPHRAPLLLLSEVVDYDDDVATARVHITAQSPFYDSELGGVPAWVGMEYMAQAIGLWAGRWQLAQGKTVRAGFLLGCRRYECNSAVFPAGSTLTVSATRVYHDDSGLGAFDCVIEAGDIRATAQIKAFLPDNPHAFVRPFSTPKQTGTP